MKAIACFLALMPAIGALPAVLPINGAYVAPEAERTGLQDNMLENNLGSPKL